MTLRRLYLPAALLVAAVGIYAAISSGPEPKPLATCVGATPCKACTNCKYCAHCKKPGNSCGVCKPPAKKPAAPIASTP